MISVRKHARSMNQYRIPAEGHDSTTSSNLIEFVPKKPPVRRVPDDELIDLLKSGATLNTVARRKRVGVNYIGQVLLRYVPSRRPAA